MSVRLREVMMQHLDALRHEPTDKRIRASLDGRTVVDSTRALLVWEPKRIVPTYAVPVDDVTGELVADPSVDPGDAELVAPQLLGRPVYDPSIPFAVHTTDGEPLVVRIDGTERAPHAFRPADLDLAGYVLLDFADFDEWFEEDERNLSHPRDPFHRVDIVHSSRAVRVELDGVVLAESDSPHLLFEPPLPVRYYFPLDDVRTELLESSELVTRCAYKGEASYFSAAGAPDVAWGYRAPLRDSAEITGRIAFFNERVDLFVDGELQERPVTPWSRPSHGDSVAGVSDTVRNKALVREFWAAAQPDKIPYLADDAVWHLPTSVAARGFPARDLKGEQVHALFIGSTQVYEPDRTWDIDHVIAEDDMVTLHCTMHARTTAGNDYHGSYHMLFRIADGKIAEAWEFLDTAYVFECMTPNNG